MASTILRNARIIDGTGRIWDRADIHVEGEWIRTIEAEGVSLAPTEGAEVVDLAGRTVIPGLMNCHVHICAGGPSHLGPAAGPTQAAAQCAIGVAERLGRALKMGVTAIRDLGGQDYVDIAMRRLVDAGVIPGPTMRVSGKNITMTGGHGWTGGIEADGVDEVRKAARMQLKLGVDIVKLMASGGVLTPGTIPGSPQLTREEMAAAVEEAHKAGKMTAAHAQAREGIRNAILAGIDSIEHGFELDDELIEMMIERGTYYCPTLTCDLRIAERGTELGIDAGSVEKMRRWAPNLVESFQKAHRAGVKIAAGIDSFAEWCFVGDMAAEIEYMVQYGMSVHDAIIAATANPAQLLQLPDEGTLEPGKKANLVVLGEDPLEDVKAVGKVRGVMKYGVWARPLEIARAASAV